MLLLDFKFKNEDTGGLHFLKGSEKKVPGLPEIFPFIKIAV